jgi:hypothetical protein
MPSVRELAERMWGKPKSVTPHQLRFGRKGSITVKLPDGVWFDFETNVGGLLRADDDSGPKRKTRAEIEAEQKASEEQREGKRKRAWSFWKQCQPAAGTLAETYLRSRGLFLPQGSVIRFHPSTWHPYANAAHPAMCAVVQHATTGKFLGVHRTFLSADGRRKADVDPARLVIGLQKEGAIMLNDAAGGWHGFAEGIETALSGHLVSGLPVWALLNAGNITAFRGVPGIEKAILFTDRDKAGYKAAAAMQEGFRGRVRAIAPVIPGHDWNDEIKRMRCLMASYTGEDIFVPGSFGHVEVF